MSLDSNVCKNGFRVVKMNHMTVIQVKTMSSYAHIHYLYIVDTVARVYLHYVGAIIVSFANIRLSISREF